MIGKYSVVLYNNKVHYQLVIERNITVLRGDSASGKSEMIRMLGLYNSNPSSSGITLICEKACTVLNEENWILYTNSYSDRIFFVDEGNSFLRRKEFADTVKGSDNYFVIVSRESLPQLPYGIDEIYGLKEENNTGKYRLPKRIYNEMFKIYGDLPSSDICPELVITEDSNSGNEFFRMLFPDRCTSSNGKSNINKIIAHNPDHTILAVVDGAAFGAEIQGCMELVVSSHNQVSIFAPESFEYLILRSGVLEVPKSITEETWNYSDSVRFFSWEEFFTAYLSEKTKNQISQYSKGKLNDYYKTAGNMEKLSKVLPECIRTASSQLLSRLPYIED
ncbi:MAG: translation initiation factor 2 [Lachnospiraceae bacterium]|nr:translation initiation factor 2 [Lachnospiraceae bacterium]